MTRIELKEKPELSIVLADDQILFAESLRTYLNNYADDMNVVGIARNGKEAVAMAAEYNPEIILMDIRMPEMDGVEAVRQIKPKHPDIKIIMLSTYQEDALVRSALLAGASGYLLKDISPAELIAAIRALMSGIIQISPQVARNLALEQTVPPPPPPPRKIHTTGMLLSKPRASPGKDTSFEWFDKLTHREREIFDLITLGYDNDEIADTLNLAVQTVRNQVSIIYSKLEVKNRFEIIRLASAAQKTRKDT